MDILVVNLLIYPNMTKPTKTNIHSNSYFENFSEEKYEKNEWLDIIIKQFNLNKNNLPFALLTAGSLVYFSITDPAFVCAVGMLTIFFMGAWQISRAVPLLNYWFGTKISFWHVSVLILGGVMLLSSAAFAPAHALFLSKLENAITDLVGNTGVDTGVITSLFNLIRIIFLLLVVAAGLYAYNQAQQGNDWRPIVVQISLAIAVVVAIDLLSLLFVGGGTTGAGTNGGGTAAAGGTGQ
jgi:hypothetical protein